MAIATGDGQNVKVDANNALALTSSTGSVFQVVSGSVAGVYKLKHVQTGFFVVGVTPTLHLAR